MSGAKVIGLAMGVFAVMAMSPVSVIGGSSVEVSQIEFVGEWSSRPIAPNFDECQGCEVGSVAFFGTYAYEWWKYASGGTCEPGPSEHCVPCDYPTECLNDDEGDSGWDYSSPNEAIAAGFVAINCGDCYINREALEAAEMIEHHQSARELAKLIESSDGQLWLNRERNALQGNGCGSRIAFHLPLSAEFFGDITLELDRMAALR